MLEFSKERIAKFAFILFDINQYLVDIVEKPSVDALVKYKDQFGKLRISMNIFSFDGSMFFKYLENCLPHSVRKEKELPTALLNMVRDNPTSTSGVPLSEHVPDLTSKEDILIVKEYVKHINLIDW